MKNDAYLKSDTSIAGDERYTPYYAVMPLLEFMPPPQPHYKIWCPFDENWSAFVQCLRDAWYTLINSSLHDGKDFFSYEPSEWDVLISNPPFSKKDAVLERAYELDKPFALLLRQTASKARVDLKSSTTTSRCSVLMAVSVFMMNNTWIHPWKAVASVVPISAEIFCQASWNSENYINSINH